MGTWAAATEVAVGVAEAFFISGLVAERLALGCCCAGCLRVSFDSVCCGVGSESFGWLAGGALAIVGLEFLRTAGSAFGWVSAAGALFAAATALGTSAAVFGTSVGVAEAFFISGVVAERSALGCCCDCLRVSFTSDCR